MLAAPAACVKYSGRYSHEQLPRLSREHDWYVKQELLVLFHVEIKTCRQGKEKWDLLDIMLDPNHFFFRTFDMSLFITLLYGARKHLYSPLTLCIINLRAYQEFPMHRVKSTWNFPCPYSITFLHEHMAFRTDPAHNLGPSFFCDPAFRWIFHQQGPKTLHLTLEKKSRHRCQFMNRAVIALQFVVLNTFKYIILRENSIQIQNWAPVGSRLYCACGSTSPGHVAVDNWWFRAELSVCWKWKCWGISSPK